MMGKKTALNHVCDSSDTTNRILILFRYIPFVAVIVLLIVASAASAQIPSRTAPAALNTNAETDTGNDSSVQLTTDGMGAWVAVWVSKVGIGDYTDILFSRSMDAGETWSVPKVLNTNTYTGYTFYQYPKLTTDGLGTWIAVWDSFDIGEAKGPHSHTQFSRSTDDGESWSDPEALNTNAETDTGSDLSPQLTTDGLGTWVAVWVSSVQPVGFTPDSDIVFSRSTDGGETWSDSKALNTNAETDTGSDWSPQLTTDGLGTWLVVWRSKESDIGGGIGTDRDILVSRSTDGGKTWSDPDALNTNADTDTLEDTSLQLATDGLGTWVAAWASHETVIDGVIIGDTDILFTRWTDTDRDNISDSDETDLYGTNPLESDSDEDGLNDYDEINSHSTDPLDQDSDDDGLFDGEEVNTYGTDPLNPDSDGDGYTDFEEVDSGSDPLNAGENPINLPSSGGGNCFIATAAYGTPLAEDIDILRAFRDQHLLTNAVGQVFTDTYYRLSPPVADLISRNQILGTLARATLSLLIVLVALNPKILLLHTVLLTVWSARKWTSG